MTFKHSSWLLSSIFLAACSASTAPVAPSQTARMIQDYTNQGHQVHVVDVSNGKQQTPAAMVLNLKFGGASDGFKTQAQSGGAAKDKANVSHLEVFLYEVTGGIPPTAGTCPTTVNLAGGPNVTLKHTQQITAALAGATTPYTQTVVFNNLPANTVTGDKYFIGVRALESGSSNISHCSGLNGGYHQNPGTFGTLTVAVGGPVALSTTGHTVTGTNYVLAPLTPQTITLNLLPANGAQLDANVTVNAGTTTLPAITAN